MEMGERGSQNTGLQNFKDMYQDGSAELPPFMTEPLQSDAIRKNAWLLIC